MENIDLSPYYLWMKSNSWVWDDPALFNTSGYAQCGFLPIVIENCKFWTAGRLSSWKELATLGHRFHSIYTSFKSYSLNRDYPILSISVFKISSLIITLLRDLLHSNKSWRLAAVMKQEWTVNTKRNTRLLSLL